MSSSAQGSVCGGRGSGAEEAGVCVPGWRLGGGRIRHQVAPTAAPAPQSVGLGASDLSGGCREGWGVCAGMEGLEAWYQEDQAPGSPKSFARASAQCMWVKGHWGSA
eukprot:2857446-Rhodomonas_salina.1